MSKSRVVWLAKQTFLRIELLASLTLSRLITLVRSALLPLVKIMKYFAGQIPLRLFTGSRGCTKNTSNSLRTESKKFVRMCRPKLRTIALNLKIPQTCPSVVGNRCLETVTILVAWSILAGERKEDLALHRKLPRALELTLKK